MMRSLLLLICICIPACKTTDIDPTATILKHVLTSGNNASTTEEKKKKCHAPLL